MADMTGQVALVTGGTRGTGLAICERLMNRGIKVAAGRTWRWTSTPSRAPGHRVLRRPWEMTQPPTNSTAAAAPDST